jgi:hypothetical protein
LGAGPDGLAGVCPCEFNANAAPAEERRVPLRKDRRLMSEDIIGAFDGSFLAAIGGTLKQNQRWNAGLKFALANLSRNDSVGGGFYIGS